MSATTIQFRLKIDNVLTDATSPPVFRDPTAAYGLRRTDTNAVVVASGQALTKLSTGVYEYTFTDPAADLTYQYWVEFVYGGATYRQEKIATGTKTQAVTLADAKEYLRLDATDTTHDNQVTALVTAAVDYVERRTNLKLLSTSVTLTLDAFPRSVDLTLPQCPLVSVQGVTYVDDAGATQTLATTVYSVDASRRPGRLVLKENQEWPETQAVAGAVVVSYTAGFSSTPELLKLCVKMLVAHWFDNRGSASSETLTEIPFAVASLLDNNSTRLAQG